MRSAFNKEVTRSIARSAGRFVAIVIISLLGAGFYAGLRMAAPDMRISADEFFDATNTYDISIVSTLGLDDVSIEILEGVEGVDEVMAAYRSDAMVQFMSASYAASIESLSHAAEGSDTSDGVHAFSDAEGYLNRPILTEGSWPDRRCECVVGADAEQRFGLSIGDEIVVEETGGELSDTFACTRFVVVGFVNAPLYISSSQMGVTSLGAGQVELYLYVPASAFNADFPYSVAYLSVSEAAGEQWDSSAYDEAIASVKRDVGQVAGEIAEQRWEAVAGKAQSDLSDAWADYDEELGAAERQFDDAAAELDAAERQLGDTAAELASADGQLADARSRLDDAAHDLSEAVQELVDAQSQLADAKGDLDSAAAELAAGQARLDESQAQLDEGEAQYEQGRADLESQRAALAPAIEQLPALKQQYEALVVQPDAPAEQLAALAEQIAQIEAGVAQLDAAAAQLDAVRVELDAGAAALAQGRAEYDVGRSEYEQGLAAYEAARASYERGRSEYEQGRAAYESGLAEYESSFDEYLFGRSEYERGRAEYERGRSEYERGRAEAAEKFAQARAELAKAQADVDDIEYPEVYVLDRTKNAGAASLSSDADGIAQIATFLPFMFFLVAALVALTSMTRMVDEERLEIGTHKALGYGKAHITSKYLVYGALASGIGSLVGVVALGKLLPWFILTSYAVSYDVPVFSVPLDPIVTVKALSLSIGVTLVATWGAAIASLRERPAALMLPRVPKAGKRIFLERIRPLWARMSFSHKVTARNLLRYKRRFFMAVVGVAGCTALLMIGFGLRDAIGGIVSNQYGELVSYDAAVRLDDDISEKAFEEVEAVLGGSEVASCLEVCDFNLIAQGPVGDLRIEVVVPRIEQTETVPPRPFDDFVTLRDRESETPLDLGDGIMLTEKAARVLGASVGDTVELFDENDVGDKIGDPRSFTLDGITENYLGHYAYLLPEGYRAAFGEEPVYDLFYVKLAEGIDASMFSDELLALDGVATVSFVADKIGTYEDMLDVMNKLIYVIMLLSAALAFVVLYNLTNINITERVREIATLKVLGFTRREVNAYIFREIIVMAFIGALLGCIVGAPLTFYIAEAAETANMMFGRVIEPTSYLLSCVITMAFAAIVAVAMRGKLGSVDMVESLKSIE